jgi:hypothetical protein
VKVGYGSSRPANVLHKKSLSKTPVNRKVKLIVYCIFSGVTNLMHVDVGFRVTWGLRTVFFLKDIQIVTPADNGHDLAWYSYYTPNHPGGRTLTGTVFVGTKHQHKAVTFSVHK